MLCISAHPGDGAKNPGLDGEPCIPGDQPGNSPGLVGVLATPSRLGLLENPLVLGYTGLVGEPRVPTRIGNGSAGELNPLKLVRCVIPVGLIGGVAVVVSTGGFGAPEQ